MDCKAVPSSTLSARGRVDRSRSPAGRLASATVHCAFPLAEPWQAAGSQCAGHRPGPSGCGDRLPPLLPRAVWPQWLLPVGSTQLSEHGNANSSLARQDKVSCPVSPVDFPKWKGQILMHDITMLRATCLLLALAGKACVDTAKAPMLQYISRFCPHCSRI